MRRTASLQPARLRYQACLCAMVATAMKPAADATATLLSVMDLLPQD
jgi:hypothetical protein